MIRRSGWLLLVLLSLPAGAAIEARDFASDLEERRYKALTAELRCPKCQNTNLAGSDAGLADDLKDRVHGLLQQGLSDDEIRQHLIARYGDFISYKPPMKPATWLLWWGPVVLLAGGLLAVLLRRRSAPVKSRPLSEDEKRRLQQLLKARDDEEKPT